MGKRFVTIFFRYLHTDWFTRRRPELAAIPFVLTMPDHGLMRITASNAIAQAKGIHIGMALADARAIFPSIQVTDDQPHLSHKILNALAIYCIRFTPEVAMDMPDGLILNASGCTHLWGGELPYLEEIGKRLNALGYQVQTAIADTIGAAWAISRFGKNKQIASKGQHPDALIPLPPEALRLDAPIAERLHKLGLRNIRNIITMPRPVLLRRFGQEFITRLDQALGHTEEIMRLVQPAPQWQERLPCLEPIVNATGIEIALQRLLAELCKRLEAEEKGLRKASFICYRIDHDRQCIEIDTQRPTHRAEHLFKLFQIRLNSIEPALGIELFVLEAPIVQELRPQQAKWWEGKSGLHDRQLSELIDRIAGKYGAACINRFFPDEHHWPERSFRRAASLDEHMGKEWAKNISRPLLLLAHPQPLQVTAPIPDYPPMSFRFRGMLHRTVQADGPERIEREWWMDAGEHRDYYCVEDENGGRYWLFRLGHYNADRPVKWFLHGFFS